jgi:predicted metal-dependent hydrolase
MKQFLLITFLAASSVVFAQGENEQIKADFQKYSSALRSRQYTQTTSYMPEQIFAFVSKERLVQEMKNALESDETETKINSIEINSFSDKMMVEGTTYVPFTFTQKFEIKYPNLFDATDDEQSRNSTTKFIVQMLNESMPESNVSFDKKTEVFKVSSIKNAVALKSTAPDSWKFLVVEAQLRKELESILPASVIKKIK